jgi:hypothetical protein
LDISIADDGGIFNWKTKYKVETRNIGGWSGYVQKYGQTGSIGQTEHAIFLNMWLDKFIFCGRSVGPTSIYLSVAERLANGHRFLLGRYLLGSVYHLLHQVVEKLLLGKSISNQGGSRWFINCGLIPICTNAFSGISLHSSFHEILLKNKN